MREERMLVRGLHCQRCIGSVERSVKSLNGVHAVFVHAATSRVIVVYEEARCDRRHIEWVIYAEGYDVIPSQELGLLNIERFWEARRDNDPTVPSGRRSLTTISW